MKNFVLLVIFTLIIGCGFKVVNKSQLTNFNLVEINTSGENRINYKLKNKLLVFNQNKNNNKSYNINLKTDKVKKIKEKNINNVITKYDIKISTQVVVNTLQEEEIVRFISSETGSFETGERHSQTISNEKKLISLITSDLADQIIDQLLIKLNDL